MAQTMTGTINKPAWVDLASADAGKAREFYAKLFGWDVEVNPDPLYGGYAIAKIAGKDAAGIGPKMDPNGPTVWNLYIGTDDVAALTSKVAGAGGTVIVAPMDVGEQGKMAVFQDPAGAFISAWQGDADGRLRDGRPQLVRVGGAQRPGRREGPPVLRGGLRLEPQDEPDGRGHAPVHRVRAGRQARRGCARR